MAENEEFPFESPISSIQTMFVELNEAMEAAQRAGFTRDEAFALIKQMHEVSWAASQYAARSVGEDEE